MHALDEKDPNYDPTDEQPSSPIVVQGTDYTYIKMFKQEVGIIICVLVCCG